MDYRNEHSRGRGRGRGRGGFSHPSRGGYKSQNYHEHYEKKDHVKVEEKKENGEMKKDNTKADKKPKSKGIVAMFTIDTSVPTKPIEIPKKEEKKSTEIPKNLPENTTQNSEIVKTKDEILQNQTKTDNKKPDEIPESKVEPEKKEPLQTENLPPQSKNIDVPKIIAEPQKSDIPPNPEEQKKSENSQPETKTEPPKIESKKETKKKRKQQVIVFTASAQPNFSWQSNDITDSNGYKPAQTSEKPKKPIIPLVPYQDDKLAGLDLSKLTISNEKFDRAKKGFLNTNISCYLNVTLQGLLACTPFYNFLIQLSKQVAPQPGPSAVSSSFLKCFAELIRYFDADLQQIYGVYQKHIVEGEQIFSRLMQKFDMDCQQQDCQEFLGFLLDGMHKELLAIKKSDPKFTENLENSEESSDSENEWMEMGEKKIIKHNNDETGNMEKTIISDIFGGMFRTELTATGKGHTTATYEPFYLISLDISQSDTVLKALKGFFSEEELSDYYNEETKEKVRAKHKQCIDRLPMILIIHLKRFVYSKTKGTIYKLHDEVKYDQFINIEESFLSPKLRAKHKSKPILYQLIGVISHRGKQVQRGHYTCCTMDINQKWEYYDDKQHNPISIKDALTFPEPYVLLYEKIES